MNTTGIRVASEAAFKQVLANYPTLKHPDFFTHCCNCSTAFSSENVLTPAGWRETQISGLCEKCWDDIFGEDDEGITDMFDSLPPDSL